MSWQERLASAQAHRKGAAASATPQEVADGKWTATLTMISPDVQRVTLRCNAQNRQLQFSDVLKLWEHEDHSFSEFYISVLAASTFDAFFFECPPVTKSTLSRVYEHVTVRAHRFRGADPESFQTHFEQSVAGATSFASLGGDSQLVSPCPRSTDHHRYGHIGAFTRGADLTQQIELWHLVATTMRQVLDMRGEARTWLSTEGSGVPWLHVRMDSRPKYYHHDAYARGD